MPSSTIERPSIEAYFDDAGNTGDTIDPVQQNLLFAAIVVPTDVADAFWLSASDAWCRAHRAVGRTAHFELKGSELYGGRGLWQGACFQTTHGILEALFDAIIKHKILVAWDGGPKREWFAATDRPDARLQRSTLFAFCNELYELLCCLDPSGTFRVIGDENDWISSGRRLTVPDRWHRMDGNGVEFRSSRDEQGLQAADILVHTLYRANKATLPDPSLPAPAISKTDELARSFHRRVQDAGLWVCVNRALARIRDKERLAT